MLFAYKPSPELAYESVRTLENRFIFGQLIRNMHYFSASLLVLMTFSHILRVFFTGGYMGNRRSNWIIGVFLLCLVLTSCFTGYLLPWDQTAYWAVTICINLLDYIPAGHLIKNMITSGNEVSLKTLHLFFTFHTTVMPVLMISFLITHFWKIRKVKGVVTSGLNPENGQGKPVMVNTYSNLLLREAVTATILIAGVMSLSLVFSAPLEDMANGGLSPNPAKAPWYFSGFQELLLHFHPFFSVFIIPVFLLAGLIALPFFPWDESRQGIWFISDKAKKATGLSVLISVILTPGFILLNEYVLQFQGWFPDIPVVISDGLIPVTGVIGIMVLIHYGIKLKYKLTRTESFQTVAAFLMTSGIIFTLTCTCLRGAGMKLLAEGV